MKKLLFIIVATFITCATFAQKKSDYEKYWQAREDSITKSQMTLSKDSIKTQATLSKTIIHQKRQDVDAVVDTLVKENSDINVNYYYNTDPFYYSNQFGYYNYGMNMWFNYRYYNDFYFGYNSWYNNDFYYRYPWFYDNNYFGYNPWFYNDFYFGYNYGYPWRYNYGYNHHNYNHNGYGNNYGVFGQRYNTQERFGSGRYVNNGGVSKKVASEGRMRFTSPSNNRSVSNQRSDQKTTYSQSKRSYSPSYNQPRMNVRPAYNNSSTTHRNINTMPQRNTNIGIQRRTESRTYSAPINRSFESSRNYNSGNASRSSNSNSNGNYSSGSRSSGGNYNSGSRSSGGSYNSGSGSSSRSSGGNYNSSSSRSSGSGTGRR